MYLNALFLLSLLLTGCGAFGGKSDSGLVRGPSSDDPAKGPQDFVQLPQLRLKAKFPLVPRASIDNPAQPPTDTARPSTADTPGVDTSIYDLAIGLESQAIDVRNFRDLVMYGVDPLDADNIIWCKSASDAKELPLFVTGSTLFRALFGFSEHDLVRDRDSVVRMSELQRIHVNGNFVALAVQLPLANAFPELIKPSECRGEMTAKLVGIK